MVRYIQNWSGGKDSTASIILEHIHGFPRSTIIFAEEMFDKKRGISGIWPEQIEWIRNTAIPIFEHWGYEVRILRAQKDYLDCFYHVVRRSKIPEHNGKYYGFPMGGRCKIQSAVKMKAIKEFYKNINSDFVQYVGIAANETKRLERLRGTNKVSLLERFGYTEEMARNLCEQYGLLSPMYNYSNRGGCWFCPEASFSEFAYIKTRHPELWAELERLSQEENTVTRVFKYNNTFAQINTRVDKFIEKGKCNYAI